MHTFEPRWAPPQERPQVGVHMDRYNMSHLILLRASCISAFSQSHDDKSPLLARGGPWAPVSFTFTFMLAGAHMRIRRYIPRYVHMETWALGFALPFIKRYIHLETWALGFALPFIKKPGQDPFPLIKRKTAHDPVAPNADAPPAPGFPHGCQGPEKAIFQ